MAVNLGPLLTHFKKSREMAAGADAGDRRGGLSYKRTRTGGMSRTCAPHLFRPASPTVRTGSECLTPCLWQAWPLACRAASPRGNLLGAGRGGTCARSTRPASRSWRVREGRRAREGRRVREGWRVRRGEIMCSPAWQTRTRHRSHSDEPIIDRQLGRSQS